jgi:hypothetical protein
LAEHKDLPPGEEEGGLGFIGGDCALCGKPTVRPFMDSVERRRGKENVEPFVCNKCLVDLRSDMATELEVRRQVGNLEARVEGLSTQQWVLYFAFTLALGALTFIAGLWLGG